MAPPMGHCGVNKSVGVQSHTFMEQSGRQAVDGDAVVSSFKVLGVQTCVVTTEDKGQRSNPQHT